MFMDLWKSGLNPNSFRAMRGLWRRHLRTFTKITHDRTNTSRTSTDVQSSSHRHPPATAAASVKGQAMILFILYTAISRKPSSRWMTVGIVWIGHWDRQLRLFFSIISLTLLDIIINMRQEKASKQAGLSSRQRDAGWLWIWKVPL